MVSGARRSAARARATDSCSTRAASCRPPTASPIDETFTVSPDPLNATVYTAEIAADEGEAVAENNTRSVLRQPGGRKRRLLIVGGAPGFEHSFHDAARSRTIRARDRFRRAQGQERRRAGHVPRAGRRRPRRRADDRLPGDARALFAYDALVIANVEGDFFTRAQLELLADFVAERGGGLLVLGGGSFAQRGLAGTPLEEVLPVELNDRRGGRAHARRRRGRRRRHNVVTLTPEGELIPIMRIGATPDETRKLWAALPALAASATARRSAARRDRARA